MSGRIKRGAAHCSARCRARRTRDVERCGGRRRAAPRRWVSRSPEIMLDVHGGIDAPMTLGGSYRYPEIETKITGDAVDLPLLGRVAASARRRCRHRRRATISGDQSPARLRDDHRRRRRRTSRTGRGAASFTSMRRTPIELQADVPEAWRVAGRLNADATLGGTFDNFQLDTTINGSALTLAGQPIDRATAKAMVTAEAIDVYVARAAPGRGLPRRPRSLRVGDRRLRREPQRRSPVVAGHAAVAERHAGDLRGAVRRRRHDRAAEGTARRSTSR